MRSNVHCLLTAWFTACVFIACPFLNMSESGKRDGLIAGETSSFPVVVDDEDVLPRASVTVQYFLALSNPLATERIHTGNMAMT